MDPRIVHCDVCAGDGGWMANDGEIARGLTDKTCTACNGEGFVEVDDAPIDEGDVA